MRKSARALYKGRIWTKTAKGDRKVREASAKAGNVREAMRGLMISENIHLEITNHSIDDVTVLDYVLIFVLTHAPTPSVYRR